MRVAALYDIHGNAPALEAVLDEVRRAGVDRIVVGGDVLPGPMPREALDRLAHVELPTDYITGNGDREVMAHLHGQASSLPEPVREIIAWTAEQLQPDDVARISTWPATCRLTLNGLDDVLFCHATPRNDTEIFTRLTPEELVLPMLEGANAALVVCGHTHMQFDRMVGKTRVVNAGSVGMPFGEPGAYWLLLGPGVELRRTNYDVAQAAEQIRATSYPHAEKFASSNVVSPPSEAQMLAQMTGVPAR